MKVLLRRAAITATTAALAISVAPAAQAEKYTHQDSWRDVTALTIDEEAESEDELFVESPAPTVRDGDITGTTIDHRRGSLVIRTKYAELTKRAGRGKFANINTSRGRSYFVYLGVNGRRYQGRAEMMGDRRIPKECRRVPSRIDYTANTITVRIPSKCIRSPKWVKVGAQSLRWGGPDGNVAYIDDAFARGYNLESQRLAMSPRVRRG